MALEHPFETRIDWPADPAQPLPPEPQFSRASRLAAAGHPDMPGDAPAAAGSTVAGYNPEELMLLSLSECHMLTYLNLAQKSRIVVRAYSDRASCAVGKGASGMTQIVEATLRPRVTVARGTDLAAARALHERAHHYCYMANSVNFPISNEPSILEEG